MKKNLVILILVAVLATVMYLISGFSQTNPIACTQEAKICPDGSAVRRIGPKCEFAPCPTQAVSNLEGEKFSGLIANMKYDCHFDGICSLMVENKQIIVGQGEMLNNPPRGSLININLDENKKNDYIGKTVEVFAKKLSKNSYTIYGNAEYYVKLSTANDQIFCGGITGIKCPEGYICQLDGNYPDAGGTCVKGNGTKPDTDYECPENNYVDCMPGPDKIKSECRPQYLEWVKENCPDFKGVAY